MAFVANWIFNIKLDNLIASEHVKTPSWNIIKNRLELQVIIKEAFYDLVMTYVIT